MASNDEDQQVGWVDPYAGWDDDLRGKKVLMTVQDEETGKKAGFVVGTVRHQNGDILHVSLGESGELEFHRQYVCRVLLDDEPVPDTLEDLPRLS